VSCPRCGAQVRKPDLMHSDWRCDNCGDVPPFHVAQHINADIVESMLRHQSGTGEKVPFWCPWPLPAGWMVTGVGWAGDDRGYLIAEALADPRGHPGPHAKIKAAGHPTPLWCVKSPEDRSAYVSEAKGMWLYAVAWPASAGYFLAEHVVLHDLSEGVPPELVYGAPSPYLHGRA
jgi:hypothetical protein